MVDHNFSHIPVFSLIEELENKINFEDWTISGINIWPIIRPGLRVYIKNSNSNHKISNTIFKKNLFLHNLLYKFFIMIKGIFFILPKIIFSSQVNYIYMTDGSSVDCIDGKWGDKYLRGLKYHENIKPEDCLILSPIAINKKFLPLEYKIYDLRWLEILSEVLSGIYVRISRLQEEFPGYPLFSEIIKRTLGHLEGFTPRDLTYRFHKIKIFLFFFHFLLKLKKIKKVFIVSFYHDMGFSINLASNRKGIVSVDIQHGTLISHDAYCAWKQIPKQGYKEFPTQYYTWDDDSSKVIRSWSGKTKLHTVIQTGNLSHKIWLENNYLTAKYDSIVNRLKMGMNGKIKGFDILVTLQPVVGFKKSWDILAEIIKKQELDVRWWLRHHPTTMGDDRLQGLDNILDIKGTNIDYHNSSNLPLCSLLRNMDLHITVRSSTYLECKVFGLQTLFISEYGALEHASSEDKSSCYFAYDIDTITRIVRNFMKER